MNYYVILGYGVTGRAVEMYLNNKYQQAKIFIYDQNNTDYYHDASLLNQDLDAIKLDKNQVITIIPSPGFSPNKIKDIIQTNNSYEIISELELFSTEIIESQLTNKVFAITGTNGKSTVCKLLADILQYSKNHNVFLGSNYGEPAISYLNYSSIDNLVLELSSFQLSLTNNFKCLAAVCLNISPDHIDWHGDYESYIKDKLKIYNQSKYDILNLDSSLVTDYYLDYILDKKQDSGIDDINIVTYSFNKSYKFLGLVDNSTTTPYAPRFMRGVQKSQDISGSRGQAAGSRDFGVNCQQALDKFDKPNINHLAHFYINNKAIYLNDIKILDLDRLSNVLKLEHNLSNLLAVFSLLYVNFYEHFADATYKFQQQIEKVLNVLASFESLEHRCEQFASYKNIKFYNDSKSTNLDSTLNALMAIGNSKIWLILGGISKEDFTDPQISTSYNTELSRLFEKISIEKIAGIVLFGDNLNYNKKLYNFINNYFNNKIIEKILIDNNIENKNIVVLDNVIAHILNKAKSGDVVLFSPAGSSFDLYKNYIERGKMFKQQVLNYININETK